MLQERNKSAEVSKTRPGSRIWEWSNVEGLGWAFLLPVFVLCVFAVISRRPDAIANPQFFAEDGSIWFADAYNYGWLHALAMKHTGYFQTLPRLGAALSLTVPLAKAPLVMNLIGLVLQVAPALFLLSSRSRKWAPLRIRVLMAIVYLALPNTSELNVSITEAQWHLGLLTCLMVLSAPPRTRLGFYMDLAVVALCGLTGPFCIVLLPLSFIMWRLDRNRWRLALTVTLGIAASVQVVSLLQSAVQTRAPMPLGASFNLLCRILVSQIFLGPLLGMNGALRKSDVYIYCYAAAGCAILSYCLARARVEWKLFIVFALAVFAASMVTPQASYDQPQWVSLAGVWGSRYWFLPMLAFVWALVWCAGLSRRWAVQFIGAVALVIFSIRVPRNWRFTPYVDLRFPAEVHAKFDTAPPGSTVSLPIVPGGAWDVKLKKK